MNGATVVWFRNDLRLHDNPALVAACKRGAPVIPVFIWSLAEEGDWPPGSANRWWLHQSLGRLAESLEKKGSRLILRCGEIVAELEAIIRATGARAVHWNRRYEPAAVAVEAKVHKVLQDHGILAESFNGGLLFEPSQVRTRADKPFQVFTAFWKACLALPEPGRPEKAPLRLNPPGRWPRGVSLKSLELEPKIDWAAGLRAAWQPGENDAVKQLRRFLGAIERYATGRDRPDHDDTSRLSPYLHFGEISPRLIWQEVRKAAGGTADAFLRELIWREFAHHLLFHFPRTTNAPLREEFAAFPWQTDARALKAWQRGRTGYPLVDAGMRQLWTTGWMHNRVRMVVASFLVKHLLIPWQEGAKWFWDTLVDADLANNTLGWQWTAGCGADAAPYFRIFNPVLQGKKFDPDGSYVRRWLPELAGMPPKWIHRPWDAPPQVLADANVTLDDTYPRPIVDHATARQYALEAFAAMKNHPTDGADIVK